MNELAAAIRAAYDRGSYFYAWRLLQIYKKRLRGERIGLLR